MTLHDDLARELAGWPGRAGVVVIDVAGSTTSAGDVDTVFAWASVTKPLTALTVLVGADRGIASLDDEVGPPGATLRHLLAHAAGLAVDSDKLLAAPGVRRVYSNRGIELAADHLARAAARPFADLVGEWVLAPLGMTATDVTGSPAHGASGPVSDLGLLAQELLAPRVLPADIVGAASTVAFPGLAGVLPGFGRQDPNDWGLGLEIRSSKAPHWTSPHGSPRTFGHFGQSGSFVWVDPDAGVACASAGEEPFGPWAVERWPALATRVLQA